MTSQRLEGVLGLKKRFKIVRALSPQATSDLTALRFGHLYTFKHSNLKFGQFWPEGTFKVQRSDLKNFFLLKTPENTNSSASHLQV